MTSEAQTRCILRILRHNWRGLKGNRFKGSGHVTSQDDMFSLGALLVKARKGLFRGAASLAYNIEFNDHYNNSRKSMFA